VVQRTIEAIKAIEISFEENQPYQKYAQQINVHPCRW
jgi:hypothetical protein